MKLKVKFDAQSIKEFFIHHTEKIVFGGAVLVLLLLAYRAMGREQLNFKPEELTKWADEADRHIQSTPAKPSRTPTDYLKKGEGIRTPIEEQLYQYVAVWDPLLFGGKALRGVPPVFPVEELRVAAGHGAVPANTASGSGEAGGFGSGGMMPGGAMPEPGMMGMPGMMGSSGPATEGLRWVVLTGVIPDAKQREEALASFEGTELPQPSWDRRQDIPELVYYKVERAEVSGESDHQQLTWTPIHVLKAMRRAQQFRGATRDVVPDRFIRNPQTAYIAFPLPPVANHTWGEEVAHEPAIPLGPSGPEMGMFGGEMPGMGPMGPGATMGAKPKPGAKREKEKEKELPKSEELPDAPMLNNMQQGMGMGGMPGGPGMMMEPGSSMGPGSPVLTASPEGYGPGGMPGSQGQVMEETRVRLFRFFDFTVEPGKRYKYRVKLMFTNPNYKLPTRVLQSADLAANRLLENDTWAETSEAIAVPRDARVLAGTVKPSVWATVEPKGTLGVAFFEMGSGAEHFEEFKDVTRGLMLNYFGRPLHSATPSPMMSGMAGMPMGEPGSSMDAMMMPPMGPEGGPPRKKEKPKPKPAPAASDKKVDYLTDSILLDMMGGVKLPGRDREATEPGRFLLLDPEGNLVIINELDCAEEVKAFNDAKKPAATSGYPGMMPGMEGSPPEMMMPGAMPPEMMPMEGGRKAGKSTRKAGASRGMP